MSSQNSEHLKRLIRSRQEFSQLTKSEVNKWKRIKQIKDNKRSEELQDQEIERIVKQLSQLKVEYQRISSEKGSAHKWAQLVSRHESEDNEFQERRNASVLKRSKHNLNRFISENIENQTKIQTEKQNQILRRKQLMKSSVTFQSNDEEVDNILRQLNDLKKYELLLKQEIKRRRDKTPQKENEVKLLNKKIVSKVCEPKVLKSNSKSKVLKPKKTNIKSFDKNEELFPKPKNIEILKMSSIDDKSEEFLPISIATKLYKRLRIHPKEKRGSAKKVYRNVSVGTTSQNISIEVNDDSDKESSIGSSHITSYLSVPDEPEVVTNRALILSKIYENINEKLKDLNKNCQNVNSLSQSLDDITLDNNITLSLDPLITRINNLKEILNKKMEQKSSIIENKSNCADSQPYNQIKEKIESFKNVDNIEENGINEINERLSEKRNDLVNDDISQFTSNSSLSFKTLQILSSSGRSSPSIDSSFQILDFKNKELDSIASNNSSFASNVIQSNISSLSSEPLRDRNAFWKEVFERAGIIIDNNKINELLLSLRFESEEPNADTFTSFTLSSFSTDPHSHSTPKR